jgi:hypothetical protein
MKSATLVCILLALISVSAESPTRTALISAYLDARDVRTLAIIIKSLLVGALAMVLILFPSAGESRIKRGPVLGATALVGLLALGVVYVAIGTEEIEILILYITAGVGATVLTLVLLTRGALYTKSNADAK